MGMRGILCARGVRARGHLSRIKTLAWQILINVLEHFSNYQLLLFGRVLGGLSTSLLFSAFESWMVTEHRKRGFPGAYAY
jgi:hypothetical protein